MRKLFTCSAGFNFVVVHYILLVDNIYMVSNGNKLMSSVLLIIDVQDYFKTSSKVIGETIRQVQLAKKQNLPIVVVEYVGCGETNNSVLRAIGDYDPKLVVRKTKDGGGKEVLEVCKKNNILPSKFRVVGVNRGYCVYETVNEIITKIGLNKVDIEISEQGTWCDDPESSLDSLYDLGCHII